MVGWRGRGLALDMLEYLEFWGAAKVALRLGAPGAVLGVSGRGAALSVAGGPEPPAWWYRAAVGDPGTAPERAVGVRTTPLVTALAHAGPPSRVMGRRVHVSVAGDAVRLEGPNGVAEVRGREEPPGADAPAGCGPAVAEFRVSLPELTTAVQYLPGDEAELHLVGEPGEAEWELRVVTERGDVAARLAARMLGPGRRAVARYSTDVLSAFLSVSKLQHTTLRFEGSLDAPALRAPEYGVFWGRQAEFCAQPLV